MMIDPETYVHELEEKPYGSLVEARRSLVTEIESLEAGFRRTEPSPVEWMDPSPDLQYKMCLECLAALASLMRKRAGELTGDPDPDDLPLD